MFNKLIVLPLLPKIPATDAAKTDTTSVVNAAEEIYTSFANMSSEQIIDFAVKNLLTITAKILIALLIYFVGRFLIKRLVKIIKVILDKRGVEDSLSSFAISFVKIAMMLLIVIMIVGVLGIDTSSFVAIFASLGIAIGMALSGTLQNFAGGVLILMLKPFKVGDFIETQGQTGSVREIKLFNIMLSTPDNKMIIIPNGGIANNIINNYSHETTRRVDWSFGIGYGDDYDKAKELLEQMILADKRILKDPEYLIVLGALANSSVNITVRAWAKTEDYWDVFFDMNEQVYKTFSAQGINIPFPQMDVHLHQASKDVE